MKALKAWPWVVLAALLLVPAIGLAESVYVSEKFEITMRIGPGNDRKIISLVQSGKPLELLEKGDEWSRVRTPNDKEGWVLNRYITTDTPNAMVLARIRKQHDALKAKHQDLRKRYSQMEKEKNEIQAALSESHKGNQQINTAYETLKKESADFLKLKKKYEKAKGELDKEKNRSATLDEENLDIKRNQVIQWVWTGGGIMLLGFLLGIFSSAKRKRRTSLY